MCYFDSFDSRAVFTSEMYRVTIAIDRFAILIEKVGNLDRKDTAVVKVDM